MKKEEQFLEWLYACGTVFYHGTDRYNQFAGYHVFGWDKDFGIEKRYELFSDLEGGDCEALDAGGEIKELMSAREIIVVSHNDPGIAMYQLMTQIRKYYYNDFSFDNESDLS